MEKKERGRKQKVKGRKRKRKEERERERENCDSLWVGKHLTTKHAVICVRVHSTISSAPVCFNDKLLLYSLLALLLM